MKVSLRILLIGKLWIVLCSVGEHFALFCSDNRHKMLVGNWSNAEEKGALGIAPKNLYGHAL